MYVNAFASNGIVNFFKLGSWAFNSKFPILTRHLKKGWETKPNAQIYSGQFPFAVYYARITLGKTKIKRGE